MQSKRSQAVVRKTSDSWETLHSPSETITIERYYPSPRGCGSTYPIFIIGHRGYHGESRCMRFNPRLLPFHLSYIVGCIAASKEPTVGCCWTWWCSRATNCSSRAETGLWFGSVNLRNMQNAPQVWRDGTAAYYRCEFLSLLECRSWRLLAAKLLDALIDRLWFRWC